jgi:hypothetical protein
MLECNHRRVCTDNHHVPVVLRRGNFPFFLNVDTAMLLCLCLLFSIPFLHTRCIYSEVVAIQSLFLENTFVLLLLHVLYIFFTAFLL